MPECWLLGLSVVSVSPRVSVIIVISEVADVWTVIKQPLRPELCGEPWGTQTLRIPAWKEQVIALGKRGMALLGDDVWG